MQGHPRSLNQCHRIGYFAVVMVVLLLTACSPSKPPLNIAGNTWLGYQPMFIAHGLNACETCPERLAYEHALPVHFIMLPSTTTTLRLLASGELDGAMLTLDEAIGLKHRTGMDICVAQVLSYSEGADGVLALPGFHAHDEIRLGYEQTALGGYMAARAAQQLDWTVERITTEYLLPREHVNALLSNQVDAVITYEPYLSQLRDQGAELLFSSADIPGEILDTLVVTRDVWNRNHKLLRWLGTDYWQVGVDALYARRPEVMEWVHEHTGLDQDALERSLSGIHFVQAEEQNLGLQFDEAVQRISSYMRAQGQQVADHSIQLCEARR